MEVNTEKDVKIIFYEMVEQGELQCDCPECNCRLVVTSDFE
jgi:hypothetical protein